MNSSLVEYLKTLAYFSILNAACGQGCANDLVPDFYVVTETSSRPRLNCFWCTDLGKCNAHATLMLLSSLCTKKSKLGMG